MVHSVLALLVTELKHLFVETLLRFVEVHLKVIDVLLFGMFFVSDLL